MNPVMVPLERYQRTMLTRELRGLWEVDLLHHHFIEDARTRYGARPDEVQDILNRLAHPANG